MESDLDVDHQIMIQAENELLAETWFFKIIVHLDSDRDFSDVLNASKKQLERILSTVSVISWAASQKSESQHLGARRIEGFVHYCSSNQSRLDCLKRVMPKKPMSGTGEIIQAAFEAIHLGRCNAYTEHPIIKNFLKKPLWIHSLAV